MARADHTRILTVLLFAGAIYFFAIALVHSLGIKVPGLFVYFSVPSYAYQDRIISFLAFGWAVFFFLSARKMDKDLIKAILVIGLVAIISLILNTLLTDFSQLDNNIQPLHFMIIITGLFIYWIGLFIFSRKLLKQGHQD